MMKNGKHKRIMQRIWLWMLRNMNYIYLEVVLKAIHAAFIAVSVIEGQIIAFAEIESTIEASTNIWTTNRKINNSIRLSAAISIDPACLSNSVSIYWIRFYPKIISPALPKCYVLLVFLTVKANQIS